LRLDAERAKLGKGTIEAAFPVAVMRKQTGIGPGDD
jgi:hypothetical protein